MKCPACGRENLEGASRCAGCGRPLQGSVVPGPGEQETSIPPPRAARPAPSRAARPTAAPPSPGHTSVTSAPGARAPRAAAGGQVLVEGEPLGTRYLIEKVLGEGGMGMVYRARDLELNRTVALKVIRPELASHPEILDRFKREILLASQVTHKNVVRIFDLGEVGDLRFISMSYIEGESLRAKLDRDGPMSPEEGVPLVRQIAVALGAAHEAGIVHRDLKPHNILIDKDGQPYIGDFGISRSMGSDGTMTETGAILGTVDYMSPEQARGEVPDHRSDLYSLGMMMFEMFTGTLPFRAANPLSVMVKRVHEDAPSPTQVRPGMPPWLSAIIMRAMVRDPAARYQSVAELLRDLDRQRATRARRKLLGKRALIAAAVVAGIAALVPLGMRLVASRGAAAPPVKTSVAILPFANDTGDPHFDWVRSGVTSVVRTGLVQAKALRVAGDDRVQEILGLLKPAPGEESRPANVQRLGRRAGVEHVLAGRLLRVGAGYRIETRLLDVGAGDTASAAEFVVDGKDEAAILGMMDTLTTRVRDALGVGRGWGETSIGAAQLTSTSVEALSLYAEGIALQRAGNDLEAVKRLEAAVAKDPAFAVAQAALAESQDALGQAEPARAAADLAVKNAGRVSPWEAARIRATRARITGRLDEAEQALASIVEATPNDPAAILDLGLVQEERGELPAALASLERAARLDPRHPGVQYALGRVQFKSGRPADAVATFNRALALHVESGNDEGRATILNGLGNVHQSLGQLDDAEKAFGDSLEIRRRIGDRRGTAVCLYNLAEVNRRRGRYDEAIRQAKESVEVSVALGDPAGQADGLMNLGDTYQTAGRPEEALGAYQESLKIMRESGSSDAVSQNLRNLGYVNGVLGHYVEAFFFMKEALAKAREAGEKGSLMRALSDIAAIEQLQGRYEEALTYDAEALGLAKESDAQVSAATFQTNMGEIRSDQGEFAPAIALFTEAEKVLRAGGDDTTLGYALAFQGRARVRLGDLKGAGAALEESIRLARTNHARATVAEALVYEGERLLALGQQERAQATLREAAQAAREVGDFRLIRMAGLASGRAARSASAIEAVLADAEKAGLEPLVGPALLELARLDFAAGRAAQARERAVKAASAAARLTQRDVVLQAAQVEGAALAKLARGAEASAAYARGLQPLEEMRAGLEPALLAAFLARPEIAAFTREAGAAFAVGSPEADRLKTIATP